MGRVAASTYLSCVTLLSVISHGVDDGSGPPAEAEVSQNNVTQRPDGVRAVPAGEEQVHMPRVDVTASFFLYSIMSIDIPTGGRQFIVSRRQPLLRSAFCTYLVNVTSSSRNHLSGPPAVNNSLLYIPFPFSHDNTPGSVRQ